MRLRGFLLAAVLCCATAGCVSAGGRSVTPDPGASIATKTDSPSVDVAALSDPTIQTTDTGENQAISGASECSSTSDKVLEDCCTRTLSPEPIPLQDRELRRHDIGV